MPTNDVSLQLILDELKGCRRQIDCLVKDVANLKAAEGEHSKSAQKFWAENWGPLKADIADIKNRLSSLEQGDVLELERRLDKVETDNQVFKEANLSARVDKLEKDAYKKQGALAAAAAMGGGGLTAFFRWLLDSGGS